MVRERDVALASKRPDFPEQPHFDRLCYGELADAGSVRNAIGKVRPDEIYHLGAQSSVAASFSAPEETADINAMGTLRLLEAIRHHRLDCKFFNASSSEIFGNVQEVPQTETTPFCPRSPYGVSKTFALQMTRMYREIHGLFACNGILFNHESPLRPDSFVTKKITNAAVAIAEGTQQTVYLGNLNAVRDWGFAGDYVQAMWRMMQHDHGDDYVIATGRMTTVREFAAAAFNAVGISLDWSGQGVEEQGIDANGIVRVAVNPEFFRPAEVDATVGDASKAQRVLGWQPTVDLDQLVQMMVAEALRA